MSFKPLEFEPEILEFWKEHHTHKKANERNKDGKKFYFCDGPPYTSGKVHIGTAWNKSLKDSILRYKRMQGFHVLDRAGYDMHGLPTENATEKKLNIKGKEQIESYGVDKFTSECKKLAIHNMKVMNKDFTRLGVWMDFTHAYQSVSRDFISGEWWLVKTAHEKGRLYEGFRSMAWDWADQSAAAKHELEYKEVTDNSIYVKFRLKGTDNDYLVIWTTTPWTIAYNLGVMVNPEIDYVQCKVENEHWIVAKDCTSFITELAQKEFTVVKEFKGEQLLGLEYIHPFADELGSHYDRIKSKHPKAHTVVLSKEYVDTTQGSGLVHMAPGCGPEDYEIGHKNNLPPWNTVKEDGHYSTDMGAFSNRHSYKENSSFIEDLDKRGALIAQAKVRHEYPHGQRSHQPVIFRATKQWFFKIEDLKEKLIAENNQITWIPKAGYNAFNAWLHNLRDNSISKQRYWGTPLPVWRNQDDPDDYFVVGSVDELEELSGQKIEEPHIPWIDDIVITKDNKTYKRVPDVLDVWVDAGTASWNSLNYPKQKENLDRYFPMDFILEGKDQIRGWFNLLHIASILGFDKPCFKAVYMHAFVQDALGRKMSKSVGNYVLPEEVINKFGADTLRYYMIGGANAGVDINYNQEDLQSKHKNLMVLWNLHRYLLDVCKIANVSPTTFDLEKYQLGVEEQYIFSLLHSTIQQTTSHFDQYKLDEVPAPIEKLFLELSRTYVQLTREKFASGTKEDKAVVAYTLYTVVMECIKLFAPVAPFICEKMYQQLKTTFSLETESVHFLPWPKADQNLINKNLEHWMNSAQHLIQSGLALREKIKRGVRWPVQEMIVVSTDVKLVEATERLKEIIKQQLNIKELSVQESLPGVTTHVKPDFGQIGPDFGKESPKIIAKLALESPQTILNHIKKEGKYVIPIDGKDVTIVKEHLTMTREIPSPYVEGECRGSFLYLNTDTTDELEAEGYAREIMRRTQAARKKAGLEKNDRITLHLEVSKPLEHMLTSWKQAIQEKVGAQALAISAVQPIKKHMHRTKEKIKEETVSIHFDQLE